MSQPDLRLMCLRCGEFARIVPAPPDDFVMATCGGRDESSRRNTGVCCQTCGVATEAEAVEAWTALHEWCHPGAKEGIAK
jgi:hypothetical protein